MEGNGTCVSGNRTVSCVTSSSSAGLAVGLTLFFLLLVIIAGVILYKYHNKIRNMLQFQPSRAQEKEDDTETPQPDSHRYTGMIREQPIAQSPIYENLNTGAASFNRGGAEHIRLSREPEEDLYLQCDSPDDAIYGNDPVCNLSILPEPQEEDVYIIPDS